MSNILNILTNLGSLVNQLQGYKTYIAAVGLIGLGVYQLSTGDINNGFQSIMGGLAAFGVRNAIAAHHDELVKLNVKK